MAAEGPAQTPVACPVRYRAGRRLVRPDDGAVDADEASGQVWRHATAALLPGHIRGGLLANSNASANLLAGSSLGRAIAKYFNRTLACTPLDASAVLIFSHAPR